MKTFRLFCMLTVVLLALTSSTSRPEDRDPSPRPLKSKAGPIGVDRGLRTRLQESYGRLPLSFEPNLGQAGEDVKFLSRGRGYQLSLKATETVLQLASGTVPERQSAMVRMKLLHSNPEPRIAGREELPGKSHYYIGNDPKRWRTNVSNYAKVEYDRVWPGIDLIYYGNQRQLEYDFVVAPGANPNAINLAFEGADELKIDSEGNLILHIAGGEIVIRKPFIYQEVNGARREVAGGYRLNNRKVGFLLGEYDAGLPLVIDPVLTYSTYLGQAARDIANDIAVDQAGNIYITGASFFSSEGWNAFVAKLNAAGTALVYATAFIGSKDEIGFGVAVDAAGNAYATGFTRSTNFPVRNAWQSSLGATDCRNSTGCPDAFVVKLDAAGTVAWSTYLGGNDNPGDISAFGDLGYDIAVDGSGQAYVVGSTISRNFPVKNAYQPAGNVGVGSLNTVNDGFITKFNAAGSDLVYSTYLGGNGIDACHGIALDAAGNAYVTGQTNRVFNDVVNSFPTTSNAFQRASAADLQDGFVTKLNAAGNALLYSTYLGGNNSDQGEAIAVDPAGNAYVVGATSSTDFPLDGAHQATNLGGSAFVTKLNPSGSGLLYSSYLGKQVWTRTGASPGAAIAVDAAGIACVAGSTSAVDFPVVNALYPTFGGGPRDAYIAKINTVTKTVVYATYLGGGVTDYGFGIALDAAGNVYVTGETNSANFPLKNPLQPTLGSSDFNSDVFVAKISDDSDCLSLALTNGFASQGQCFPPVPNITVQKDVFANDDCPVTITVTRNGVHDKTFTDTVKVTLTSDKPKLGCLRSGNQCADSLTLPAVAGEVKLKLQTPLQDLTRDPVIRIGETVLAGTATIKAEIGSFTASPQSVNVKSPLDLKIDRIEVQQGVKQEFSDPWVQYRDLLIRVFLDANRTEFSNYESIRDITAQLTVRNQTGAEIEGSPFMLSLGAFAKGTDSPSQPYIFIPNPFPDPLGRESLNHVLYVTQPQLNLSVKLNEVYPDKDPGNNEKSLPPLNFATSRRVTVLYSPARLKSVTQNSACPTEAGIAREINFMQLAYPVSFPESAGQLRFIQAPNPGKNEACEVLTDDPLPQRPISKWWFWLNRTKLSDVKAWVYFVDNNFFSLVNRPSNSGITDQLGGSVSIVSDRCLGPDTNSRCGILAHELGHVFSLGDTYQSTAVTPVRNLTVNPPQGDAQGNPVGSGVFSWFHHRFSFSATDFFDFMGKSDNSWTDWINWNYLRTQLLPAAKSVAPFAADTLAAAADNFVIVQGQVRKDGAAELTTCYTLTGAGLASADGSGDYVIEMLDGNAGVLNSLRFAPSFRPPDTNIELEAAAFSFALPFSSAVRELRIRSTAGVLATRQVSAAAPVISITTDFGGQTLTGVKTVSWSGSDADGNALSYSLFYSPDGQLQIPLALETGDTSYEWDTATVPAGSAARLTLTATDGLNATTIESSAFTLPNRAPSVVILAPAEGQQFKIGETVHLEAALYDAEEGPAWLPALTWSSNLQGALGTGKRITLSNLQAGTHLITASGADGQGASGSASVTVLIRPDNFSNIEATPGTIDFGSVAVGQSRDFRLSVNNTGNIPFTVNNITSNNPQFVITSPALPFTVAERSQQEVIIRYAPLTAATQVGTLTITSNATNRSSVSVSLVGEATGAAARAVATVSAASYQVQSLAAESIVSAFGAELATGIVIADTLPLPTMLAGTTVRVKDSLGVERLAPLFFVSPNQINYEIPAGTAIGVATVTIVSGNGAVSIGTIQIVTVAPGLFSANASGQGVASALLLRVRADGSQGYEPVARFDTAQNSFVAVPIEPGPPTDQLYLILFGTGLRYNSGLALVTCKLGGVEISTLYAGAQGGYAGLDQINIGPLPRSLAGRGELDMMLTVDGRTANTVRIAFGGAPTCSYAISPTSQSFNAGANTGAVNVRTDSGCAWMATSNAGFITITGSANGSGNGVVNYSVAANTTTTQRSGTLTIAGQTFTVTQAAAAPLAVMNHRLTGGPIPDQCSPPAAKTAFLTTDQLVYQWTLVSGAHIGDLVRWEFIRPDGTLYTSSEYTITFNGGVCIWAGINIAGTAAASIPGNWQVRVLYNGELLLTENFMITAAQ